MEEIWTGHRDRLRRKAEQEGWDSLRVHEMVELILYYAIPRQDMSDIARNIVQSFGSLESILDADYSALMAVPGVSRAMVDWIMLTGEMVRAYRAIGPDDHTRILCFGDALRFILPRRRMVHSPECWMIYTDFDNRLLARTILCDSLSCFESEYARQAIKEALAIHARHAILVMFMGVYALELDDGERQRLLYFSRSMRGIDVEIMDCILVGESGVVSMNVSGLMDDVRSESLDLSLHERYAGGRCPPPLAAAQD